MTDQYNVEYLIESGILKLKDKQLKEHFWDKWENFSYALHIFYQ